MVRLLSLLITLIIVVTVADTAIADTVRLKCIADTNISSYSTEQSFNYGKSSRLRLKGIEMIGLFQFDTALISNWTVRSAALYLRYAGADRKLRTLGLSTISAPWSEGTGAGEAKPGEACFLRNGANRWAGTSTDFTDVSFTAGNTLAAYAEITVHENDWISVPVDPKLVQAMIVGATYGLAVSDEKGQTMANNDVYSREQNGSEPYLVVEGSLEKPAPPHGGGALTVKPDSAHTDYRSAAIAVTIAPPIGTFSYDIALSYTFPAVKRPVDRASIPFATPRKLQTFHIGGLPPGRPVELTITPIAADGSRGKIANIMTGTGSLKSEPAALTRPPRAESSGTFPQNAKLRVWAVPDTEKVNPRTGSPLDVADELYNRNPIRPDHNAATPNAVWNRSTVTLAGARNEIVGFQLVVETRVQTAELHGISVNASKAFANKSGTQLEPQITLYRDWYVNVNGSWFPEACIPVSGPFDVPAADNKIESQRNQSIFVDMQIPENTTPGTYNGSFTVSMPGEPETKIPVVLTVNSLTLPNTLSFDISLNTYGTFGGLFGLNDNTAEYRAIEKEFHRMAYTHRSTLAPLGYSHTGNTTTNYAPPVAGAGAALHVTDWSTWDRQFGAYLDGSAFADLPRKGVPISHLYLPFHEAWPVDIRKHYSYNQTVLEYPAMITEHAMKAAPIEEATDQELRDGFKAIAAEFAAHFREKGWTHTQFQFYENDKYYYKDPKQGGRGTSWWLLDEPNHRDDWLVLAFFDRLFEEGIGKSPGVNFVRREDISRPQWQRDYLDGMVDVMCVSSELFTKGPRLSEMQEKLGVKYWNYGTANSVNRPNAEAEAWAVRAWMAGADAIVPWQSIGEDKNFDVAEDTALLLPGTRFGVRGPIASMRLKALRRAQQDVEYLVLLAKQKSWDREQVGSALREILSLNVTTVKADDNDAGSYQFKATHSDDFDAVRKAIGALGVGR